MGRASAYTGPEGLWQVRYDAEGRTAGMFTADSTSPKGIRGGYVVYQGTQPVALAGLDNGRGATCLTHTVLWDPAHPEATRPLALTRVERYLGTEMPSTEAVCLIEAAVQEDALLTRSASSSSSALPFEDVYVETGESFFYLHDHNKNVVGLMDSQGVLKARYEYDPYGNPLHADGVLAEENRLRFSSELCNPVTGLVDYLFRSYNPADGRWSQRDPILEQGGVNLFSFVGNAPNIRHDTLGLFWGEIFDAICAIPAWLNFADTINKEYENGKKIDGTEPPEVKAEYAATGRSEDIQDTLKGAVKVVKSTSGMSISSLASPGSILDHGVDLAKGFKKASMNNNITEKAKFFKALDKHMTESGYTKVKNKCWIFL